MCEIEISHVGKNNGNPDLVCENKISYTPLLQGPGQLKKIPKQSPICKTRPRFNILMLSTRAFTTQNLKLPCSKSSQQLFSYFPTIFGTDFASEFVNFDL